MSGRKEMVFLTRTQRQLIAELFGKEVNTFEEAVARGLYDSLKALERRRANDLEEKLRNLLAEALSVEPIPSDLRRNVEELNNRLREVTKRLEEASRGMPTLRKFLELISIHYDLEHINLSFQSLKDSLENFLKNLKKLQEGVRKGISSVEKLMEEGEDLLKKYFPSAFEKLKRSLEDVRSSFKGKSAPEELKELYSKLTRIQSQLLDLLKEGKELEEANKSRNLVLEALRKTVQEMGWRELGEPHLEREGDPRSDIIYEVDTYTSGKMTFRLSLERILIDSPFEIEEGFCLKQFEEVMKKLKNLGIDSELKLLDFEDEDPILLEKEAVDLYSYDEMSGYMES